MWFRKRKLLLCILLGIIFAAGCGSSGGKTKDTSRQEDKIQIGMVFDSFIVERWQRDRDVFVSIAKELGAEVNVQNPNRNIEEQKKQIEYLIEQDMDVIVIVCIDSEGIKDTVQKARSRGIKIIAYDRLICDTDLDLYISFDNEEVGRLMGSALIDKGISGGNVLMLGGPLDDNNVSLVERGFKGVMENNHVNIVGGIHAESWQAEQASAYIYENLSKVANVDGIMCGNDNIAGAVVRALSEKRRAGDILVVGQDAELEACQRIVEGTQAMTVYKPVEKLAKKAAEYAVQIAKGEKLEEGTYQLLKNGIYQVPYVNLEPYAVTEENINELIIDSGFHLKEDVYLNVPYKMPD